MKTPYFTILPFFLALLTTPSFAQSEKTTELGVVTSNLRSFGLHLKRGEDDRFIRYRVFTVAGNSDFDGTVQDSLESRVKRFGGNVGLGITFEKRKSLSERVHLFRGPDLALSVGYSYQEEPLRYITANGYRQVVSDRTSNSSWNLKPSFGYRIGIMYDILDNLYASAEVAPGISYSFSHTRTKSLSSNEIDGSEVGSTLESGWSHSPTFNLSWGVRFGLFYRFG